MTGPKSPAGTSGTILVIDDEQIVVDSLRKVLDFVGWRAEVVYDVASARRRLAGGDISALMTDIMLPNESGEVLLKEIVFSNPEIPVVMITGYGTTDLALKMLNAGAFDFIPKPFSFEEMCAMAVRIGRFLSLSADERIRMLRGLTTCPESGHRRFCLRGHCWVSLESDGLASVGIGGLLARTTGPVASLRLPQPGEEVTIANHCAWLIDGDGHEHGLRAPLSGKVVSVADERELLEAAPGEFPFQGQVFLRIKPARFAVEMTDLVPCPSCGG
jgi:CheY-like chemotaxis protein